RPVLQLDSSPPRRPSDLEAGAHRGTAQRQLAQVRQRALHVADAVVELRHPAGGLLAQRQRRRVLQMRAADLHDLAELLALPGERDRKSTRLNSSHVKISY